MTAKEKAKELVNRMTRPTPKNEDFNLYDDYYNDFNNYGKQCALIAVDEMINYFSKETFMMAYPEIAINELDYCQEVKTEIEKL